MATSSPQVDYTQEVRFAVVMYGGVSLAIYINGIAQELLHLVRSTAGDPSGDNALLHDDRSTTGVRSAADKTLGRTERVYRKLSYLLADAALLSDYRRSLAGKQGQDPDILEEAVRSDSRPINIGFIVDILSGTSAGGINAIYLAKALANDQQIDQLKELWINEGDIALLLNDKKSVAGLGLSNQKPPLSLLNGRRMYSKLLASLDDMEPVNQSKDKFQSPYVDELDLFITTTDIEGVPLPLRLWDTVVYERRHRNVLHFKYARAEATGEDWNHFTAHYNPFLAFAARCTSSFPFAFEPMRLCDIDEVLDTFPRHRDNKDCRSDSKRWRLFFKENVDPGSGQPNIIFEKRSFGDGGYLDNKPFSYATETLMRRHASVPVDRKLIYIEPSPEHPEDRVLRNYKPDAIENVKAALLDLPSYETIREDLQRVLQRNRAINRVNKIIRRIERDVIECQGTEHQASPQLHKADWAKLDLAEMVEKFGPYYLPYGRLRVASVTDDLTSLVARIANYDEDSAQFIALRSLIQAWRDSHYADYHIQGKKTMNQFLLDYDFNYWPRRLNFLRKKIDELYQFYSLPAGGKLNDAQQLIVRVLGRLERYKLSYEDLSNEQKLEMRKALAFIKHEMNGIYKHVRVSGRTIRAKAKVTDSSSEKTGGFPEKVLALGINTNHLNYILGMAWVGAPPLGNDLDTDQSYATLSEEECVARARELLDSPEKASHLGLPDLKKRLDDAADILKQLLEDKVFSFVTRRAEEVLKPNGLAEPGNNNPFGLPEFKNITANDVNGLREYLWSYYRHFDDYDQISFPILYNSDVGEADVVDVIRISPEDATSLINERMESKKASGRHKLAGTALHHFGAFLDRTWRENDIMWGRLDGAERLINAMLPGPENANVRAALVKEAHIAILKEELPAPNRLELSRLMSDALMLVTAGASIPKAIDQVLAQTVADAPLRKRLQTIMFTALEDQELLTFMKDGYEINRKLESKPLLSVLSRSTQVVGHMFEYIANQNSLDGRSLAWIARLGQVFWGLGVTVAINVIVLLLRDRMRVKNGWLYVVTTIFVSVILMLAGIGVDDLFHLEVQNKLSERVHAIIDR